MFIIPLCIGIGGRADMKLIYGIIAAEGKARAEKEDKVIIFDLF